MNSIYNKLMLGTAALGLFLVSCTKPDNTNPIPELSSSAAVRVAGNTKAIRSGQNIATVSDTVILTFKIKAAGGIKQIDFNYNGSASYEFVNKTGWYQQRGWIPVVQKRDNFISGNEEEFSVKVYNVTSTFTAAVLVHDGNNLQNSITQTVYSAGELMVKNATLFSQNSAVTDAAAGMWKNFLSTRLDKTSDTSSTQLANLSTYGDLAYAIDSVSTSPMLISADSAIATYAPHTHKEGKATLFKNGSSSLRLVASNLTVATATTADLITTDFTNASPKVNILAGKSYAFITPDNRIGLIEVSALTAGATSTLANAQVDFSYIVLSKLQ